MREFIFRLCPLGMYFFMILYSVSVNCSLVPLIFFFFFFLNVSFIFRLSLQKIYSLYIYIVSVLVFCSVLNRRFLAVLLLHLNNYVITQGGKITTNLV